MAKVLVTGAAGFIGRYLVTELLDRGYEVTGLDDLSKYGEASLPGWQHPGYRFVRGDAADPELLISLLAGCDHLVAAAAQVGGIGYFHAYPFDLLAANTGLTAAACQAAIQARRGGQLAKVTYLSSSMVYECASSWPSREGQELAMAPPVTAYGFSKLAVEYFARAAWDQYQLPFTIVRPFNCVGTGETRPLAGAGGHVVPDLVCKALRGQDPLRVLGSGHQLRHYTYGGDLAAGIALAMEHPLAAGEDFNLASDQGTTVAELAALIWRKVRGPDSPPRIAFGERPYPGDVQRRIPDTDKARRVLGFTATTTLGQMLDEVIAWARDAMAAGLL